MHRLPRSALRFGLVGLALAWTALGACGGESSNAGESGPGPEGAAGATSTSDGGTEDAPSDAGASDADAASEADAAVSCDDKAKSCASEFGALFTKSNGRADGTLVALVRPVDAQCALPNGTHVVLQLSMQNQVQRLVASIDGVAIATKSAPLLGPPYSEGWHENVEMEYASDLGVHSTDFSPASMDEAIDFICSHLDLGAPVSVYAYSDGSKPDSAHQIHSNDGYPDGAIVVDPTSSTPTYLLFRYLDQVF